MAHVVSLGYAHGLVAAQIQIRIFVCLQRKQFWFDLTT